MLRGLDYTSPISPSALRQAGVQVVFRYIALGSSSKHITAAELAELRAAEILVGLVAESSENQMDGGFAQGAADARSVQSALLALGLPTNHPVAYAHDKDGTLGVSSYLDGVASVVGPDSAGIYGGRFAVEMGNAHWVAVHPGRHLGIWQTLAWSGAYLVPGVDWYQGGGHAWSGSYADYHVTVSGVSCDKDTAFTTWGLISAEGETDMALDATTDMATLKKMLASIFKVGDTDILPDAIDYALSVRDAMNKKPELDPNRRAGYDYLRSLEGSTTGPVDVDAVVKAIIARLEA